MNGIQAIHIIHPNPLDMKIFSMPFHLIPQTVKALKLLADNGIITTAHIFYPVEAEIVPMDTATIMRVDRIIRDAVAKGSIVVGCGVADLCPNPAERLAGIDFIGLSPRLKNPKGESDYYRTYWGDLIKI